MIACLRYKNKLFRHVNATVGGTGVICNREQKQKTEKIHPCANCVFLSVIAGEVNS